MLADTPERMDWLKMSHARGRYLGMETELISAEEAQELLPILDPQYFVGAMWDAHEGHLDPSQITHAYLECARNRGAETHRHSWVRDITRAADGGWDLTVYDPRTDEDKATVHCEHVVNAGGLWAREVGRMVGLELPLLAMEHMYLLTEEIPEVIAYNEREGKQLMHAIDFGGEIYMRQEGNGLLLGTYEQGGKPWAERQTSWEFGARLLTPDLERIAESLDTGFKHFPIFAEAGIKQVINGPFTFASDGNPLLGPVRGLPGYWSACAVMAGLSQGGGVGLSLANWIVDGDPGADVWGMDIARYGDFATMAYTNEKVRENFSRRFRITFPNEFLPAGRGVQTSPIYDRLRRRTPCSVTASGWRPRSGSSRTVRRPSRTSRSVAPTPGTRSARRPSPFARVLACGRPPASRSSSSAVPALRGTSIASWPVASRTPVAWHSRR